MTGDTPRFMAATNDKGVAAALDARERREQAINRDGFRSHGLREGSVLQGLDGRVWRVLGPSTLRGSDALVDVVQVAWEGRGAEDVVPTVVRRYARTVALWTPTELHLASIAEKPRTQADGTPYPSRGAGPSSPAGAGAQTLSAKRPAMPGGPQTTTEVTRRDHH